ncbi:sodium-coupled neutral amino acid transporter 7-like isoform X2 [Tubulanus polymorphus]
MSTRKRTLSLRSIEFESTMNDITETTRLLSSHESQIDIISPPTGTTWYASIFLVVNAALGAGLLALPAAFSAAGGITTAISVQAVLMVFIVSSLLVLAYCSDVHQSATYQDVIYSLLGRTAQTICSVCIVLYCFGTCITFFIVVGDQWDRFFFFVHGDDFCHYWYFNRVFTMIATSIFLILPLCYAKRIDFLKYASFLGVIGIIYIVILVIVKYFTSDITPGTIKEKPDNFADIFIVVPVICFGYQCHVSAVPIYSCLKNRSVIEFSKTLVFALIICALAYSVTASFGYLTFGDNVDSDILVSYYPDAAVLVAIAMMAGKTYTTFPILAFCGRSALDSVWCSMLKLPPDEIAMHEKRRRIVQTTIWFLSSLALAVFIPNIGVVISLLGSLAALFIFLFPGLCLLQVAFAQESSIKRWKYWVLVITAVIFIVLGTFILGVVSVQSIMNDVNNDGTSKPSKSQLPCT